VTLSLLRLISDIQSKKGTSDLRATAFDSLLALASRRRELLVDSVNMTELALHKFVKAEEIADKHKTVLDRLKLAEESNLWELERKLEVIGNDVNV